MQKKLLAVALVLSVGFGTAGCSIFYPNPIPTKTPTPTTTPTSTTTPTPTIDPNLEQVELRVIDASAFRDNGTVNVIAEVLGILEDDGKCTLLVSQGATSQSITVAAESNVTSTQCFPMALPLTSFKDGALTYTVTYVSDKSAGVSEAATISIQ